MPERSAGSRRTETGFAAWGPGFYVWEEDLGDLLMALRDLRAGRRDAGRDRPRPRTGDRRTRNRDEGASP